MRCKTSTHLRPLCKTDVQLQPSVAESALAWKCQPAENFTFVGNTAHQPTRQMILPTRGSWKHRQKRGPFVKASVLGLHYTVYTDHCDRVANAMLDPVPVADPKVNDRVSFRLRHQLACLALAPNPIFPRRYPSEDPLRLRVLKSTARREAC